MASMRFFSLGLMMVVMVCVMSASTVAYIIPGVKEATVMPLNQTDETTVTDMMTSEEEKEVDEMFPDQMRNDLKLELILKALVILKEFEGESVSVSVSSWLPPYDVMPDELKLRLILKALILLKERRLDAMFAGHTVGELKLTLLLKALLIVEESKTDFSLGVDKGDLKLALILKAIDVIEVYQGDFVDTVFFTESKKHLKLVLILKAVTLLKHGKWPVDIADFWPMGEEEEAEGSQSEVTEQSPTSEGAVEDTTTVQPEVVTSESSEATTTTTEDQEPSKPATEQTTVSEPPTEPMTTSADAEEAVTDEGVTHAGRATATTKEEIATKGATTTAEGAVSKEGTAATKGAAVTEETRREETTAVRMTKEPALATEKVVVERGDIPINKTKGSWLKHAFSKVLKWLKGLPKVLHEKKHNISH